MMLAIYQITAGGPGARSEAYAESFPSKEAAKQAKVYVAHPMSPAALAHFASRPKPIYDARKDRYAGCAPSFTPYDPSAFR